MEQSLTGTTITTVIALLIAIMAVALASKYIKIPYTVALVIVGLIVALTPVKLPINLTPDLILFIFLPALLFEAAYNLSFQELRENLRPIAFLAVPGVLVTAGSLAAAIYYAVGVDWGTAFLFGAIMSATDPVSVLAIFRQLGAPRRLSTIIEGESLFNDGTSLVIFRIMLGLVVTQAAIDPVSTVWQFVVVVAGGLVLGGLIGYVVSLFHARVNDYLVETTMTLVVAYGTYLLAEQLGVSGVIAVVVAALVIGNYGRAVGMSATTRLAVSSTWEFFGFVANSLIFLLLGLELNIGRLRQYWLPTVIAILAVLLVRALVVMASSWILKYLHRPIPYRWQSILVWGGLRGSLSLAMALSLPFGVAPASPFPYRDLIQVMTFGVILFTLLVQGLTMEPLLLKLGLISTSETPQEYQIMKVRRAMAAAALAEIDRMSRSGGLPPDLTVELRKSYVSQLGQLDEDMESLHLHDEDLRREQLKAALRRILQVEKSTVRQRHLDGTISEDSMQDLLGEINSELYDLDNNRLDAAQEIHPSDGDERQQNKASKEGGHENTKRASG